MSLGTRIKEVLHGSDADPDNVHPPGSFPTDDMAPNSENTSATSHHERNKLHKSNDPRGKNHGHSDSGVGLHPSNEPAVTKEPVEEAYAPAEGYEERREHAKRSDVAEFDDVKAGHQDTTEYNVDPKDLGTTVGTTSGAAVTTGKNDTQSHNVVRTGTNPSTVEHKDPYWGDIPQGQGVYNTVSGHGSTSDEARRHHTTDDNQGQGVYNTVAGHGSTSDETRRQHSGEHSSEPRAFPLVTDRTRQHHEDPTTQAYQPEKTEEKKDSHWKEGAAGAAATGAAGAAAYKATRDDEDRTKTAQTEETAEEKEEKGRGGLFGVFHRGHKDDKDTDKDHHHKDKEHHHKDKHSKEDKVAPIAAAGFASSRDDKRQEEQRYQNQNPTDSTRSTKTDPALAAAAVAYSQHSGDRNTSATHHNDPATRGNEGEYNTLSSGTASGVRTGDTTTTSTTTTGIGTRTQTISREEDEQKESNRNAAVYGSAGAAAALGAGGYAAHEYRKDRDDKNEPVTKDTRQEPSSSGGWFTSPVTHTSQTTDPAQSQRDNYTSNDSANRTGGFAAAPIPTSTSTRDSTFNESANPAGGFAAAPISTSTSSRDPAVDNYHSSAAAIGSSEPAVRQPSAEIPRVTEEANHGKYNTLSSGTPSGINLNDGQPKATSTLPTVADESSNKGAMATAGLAAVGAGAGAAALASRRDDNKEKAEEPLKKDTYISTAVPGHQKVTHKCVKCGEENDISQYFKEQGRRGI